MQQKTNWTLYSENEEAWESMLEDCANAKKSIALEQFIFQTDDFGKKLIDVCAARAAEGVKVRFLWDAAGSFSLWGSNIAEDLRSRGIELVFWKTLIPGYFKVPNVRAWFLRNHRRTLVIDDCIGYTGSICVHDRFKNWRDTNVRIQGESAREMQNAFDRMWDRAKKSRPLTKRIRINDSEFRYVTNFPAPGRRHVYTELVQAIRQARHHIYLTAPYFVPTHKLAHALKSAAVRGVDVRLIIPEKSDYYTVDLGARSFFGMLLQSGVRIFLYQGNMIHSKVVTIDETWSSVGSMNLDSISLLYNFEANIISRNPDFAGELARHFARDLKESKEVYRRDWQNRLLIEKIPEILIRLVRKFL